MKNIKRLFFVFIVSILFFSCGKELSLEGGRSLPIVDTTGSNCKIERIIESDYFSKVVEYAYISTYTADHKVSSIQVVDSVNNNVENAFPVTYSANKILVDTDQYFLTGTDGKVTEFHGYEYPEDNTSEKFTVKYTYNTAGQLIKRTEEYNLAPGITSFEMDYTYIGGNLTRTEAKRKSGSGFQTFINVSYEYETSKAIKNFIYFNAVAPEIFYFQTAINAGATSINPLKKATTTFVKLNNGQDSTTVANFVNYSYDTKGHVLSFEITGGDFVVNNLYAGKKYAFKYECY